MHMLVQGQGLAMVTATHTPSMAAPMTTARWGITLPPPLLNPSPFPTYTPMQHVRAHKLQHTVTRAPPTFSSCNFHA